MTEAKLKSMAASVASTTSLSPKRANSGSLADDEGSTKRPKIKSSENAALSVGVANSSASTSTNSKNPLQLPESIIALEHQYYNALIGKKVVQVVAFNVNDPNDNFLGLQFDNGTIVWFAADEAGYKSGYGHVDDKKKGPRDDEFE